MAKSKALTPKQESFVQEYLKDLNATAAYKRAFGSKDGTARTESSKLLANPIIRARVDAYRFRAEKKTNVTQERVLKELATVAFASIGLMCDWDDDNDLTLKPKTDLTPEDMAAIQSIQSNDQFYQNERIGRRINFKMHDKLKALELLCKHLGILDGTGARNTGDRVDVTQRLRKSLRAFMGE